MCAGAGRPRHGLRARERSRERVDELATHGDRYAYTNLTGDAALQVCDQSSNCLPGLPFIPIVTTCLYSLSMVHWHIQASNEKLHCVGPLVCPLRLLDGMRELKSMAFARIPTSRLRYRGWVVPPLAPRPSRCLRRHREELGTLVVRHWEARDGKGGGGGEGMLMPMMVRDDDDDADLTVDLLGSNGELRQRVSIS